jgi:uncharacterized protein (DUF433 family)
MSVFLKLIGSADAPWHDFYDKEYVDFSRRPNQVQPGDFLVLYAAGGLKRVFALAEVKSQVYEARSDYTERWPYRVDISYLVNLPATEGVRIEEVNTPKRNLLNSLKTKSYLKLYAEEYEQALVKLHGALSAKLHAGDEPHLPADKRGGGPEGYSRENLITLPVSTGLVPLETDAVGVVRVGGTRVSLDSVIFSFKEGSTPEEIVQQYTTLNLAHVYEIIGYYLQHRAEVEEYLATRRQQRDEIRKEVESRFDPQGIRDRLLARRRRIA